MKYNFLRKEKKGNREQMTFVGNEMKIYIPHYFFDKGEGLAEVVGDKIETMGIFWFSVDNKFYELQLPVKMMFEFSSGKKDRLKLQPQLPSLEYMVYTLKHGDAFMYDVHKKRDSDDVGLFMNKLIEGAKLPPTVPYNEVFPIFLKMLEVTKTYDKLGVPALNIEFILSELFRTKSNTNKPFRVSFNGKTTGVFDYRMIRITKVPEMNSTFTGLIGEDVNHQLVSAIVKNRGGRVDRVSPIEKTLKY